MLQLELKVMLPLTEQRDLQHHEVVQVLMHLARPKLEPALLLPELELQELLQLRERLVVSALQTQLLESMAELEPLPPEDLRLLRT
jgi:hypothetical protein